MLVKELIEELKKMPQDLEVYMRQGLEETDNKIFVKLDNNKNYVHPVNKNLKKWVLITDAEDC